MAGYFELKATPAGFSFNLKAGNHEVILSSQVYKSKESALEGIASVRANAPDEARFERKTSTDGSPYFVLLASNGQTIGRSEMYTSIAGRDNGIRSVMSNGPSETVKTLA